jgi:MraZ protein
VFLGTYRPKLDDKGRFFLPAKFRDELAGGVVITRSQERSLAIYPTTVFEAMVRSMNRSPATLKQVRDFQRMLAAGASDEIPDRQGRVSIPPALRQYAGLDKDIVVIGSIDRLEVWDAAAWETYSTAQEAVFAELDSAVLGTDSQPNPVDR